ncbi:MAG: radical SAM protein [bacterium]|nr:radical SAM protein [bacterium]
MTLPRGRPAGQRVFGPVPSRRLGRSLGVDVVPLKTCTLDCVYCQLGRTARRTVRRRRQAPVREVMRELRSVLRRGVEADWITFSGSGEPTLHAELGRMVRAVKRMTRIPVAVLTNGTLLFRPAVREALAAADLVVPDLDAGSARVFRLVNRPHPSLSFRKVARGIEEFARGFRGRIWLEVVLVRGVNDGADELRRIGRLAARIRPERVQLNTVARPPAERWAAGLTPAGMERARRILQRELGPIPVEPVARRPGAARRRSRRRPDAAVLACLARRPETAAGLSASLGIPPSRLAAVLRRLARSGAIRSERFGGERVYLLPRP